MRRRTTAAAPGTQAAAYPVDDKPEFFPPESLQTLKRLALAGSVAFVVVFAVLNLIGNPAAALIGEDARQPIGAVVEQAASEPAQRGRPQRDAFWNVTRGDGLLVMHQSSLKQAHPIRYLMRRAAKQWEQMEEPQSKTFDQAVRNYRSRYGMAPPRGFDRWYAFARAKDVKLIDEYDVIMDRLKPFHAFTPANFRRRYEAATALGWMVSVQDGRVSADGQGRGIAQLMSAYAHELPDFSAVHADGAGHVWIAGEKRERLLSLVKQGKLDFGDDLAPKETGASCPPGSALRSVDFHAEPEPIRGSIATFIANPRRAFDCCHNPSWRHAHEACDPARPSTDLLPIFSASPIAGSSDLLSVDIDHFEDPSTYRATPWSERTDMRAVFRGFSDGQKHRERLVSIATEEDGKRTLLLADDVTNKIAVREGVANYALNRAYLDVEPRSDAEKYMFEIDVDDSVTNRFAQLLLSSTVPLISTTRIQHWRDIAIPWLHYVPISPDLHGVLAYFRGGAYGELPHKIEAEAIASAGQAFAKQHLRYEDLQAFMFRSQLEYARLWNSDQRDYTGSTRSEPVW